jgi:hypothetical protein
LVESFGTIAEVAVTLAGFSGLFFAFQHRSGESFSDPERRALTYLLVASLGAAVLGLLPLALGSFVSAPATWVALPLLSGAYLVILEVRLLVGPGSRFPWVRRFFMPLNWLVIALQFTGAAGLIEPSVCFAMGLWWLVLCAAVQFLAQVLSSLRS